MQVDTAVQLRNFKDFLQLYNQMTENCFTRCVDEMNSRNLNRDEVSCVDLCSTKFINVNHKVMSLYVDVQSALVTKRVEEAQASQAAAEASQLAAQTNQQAAETS